MSSTLYTEKNGISTAPNALEHVLQFKTTLQFGCLAYSDDTIPNRIPQHRYLYIYQMIILLELWSGCCLTQVNRRLHTT